MTAEERRALLDRAITTYGAPAQMDMAVEEMAELTKALCKVKRVSCAAEAKAALENAVEELLTSRSCSTSSASSSTAPPRRPRRRSWKGWPEGYTPDTSKTE